MSIRRQIGPRTFLIESTDAHERGLWKCHTIVDKYDAGYRDVAAGLVAPYETLHVPGNVVLYGGVDLIWLGLKNLLNAASTGKLQFLTSTKAGLLVGISTAAAAATQTDLQASSGAANRWVHAMDATYPQHTTGAAASTSAIITFKATFTTAEANFAWREWGVGNKAGAGSGTKPYLGRLVNRKVTNLGTKTTAGTWALTVQLSIA